MTPGAHALWDVAARLGTGMEFTTLRPVSSQQVISGPAFPVTIEYSPNVIRPVSAYQIAQIIDSVPAGHVLLIDAGRLALTTMGGLAAERLRVSGAAGAVVNGYVRDVDELEAAGVPVFALGSGFRSIASHAQLTISEWVAIDGYSIYAGDLITGCSSGIVAIPKESSEAVLREANELDAIDSKMFEEIRAGAPFSDVWKKYKER